MGKGLLETIKRALCGAVLATAGFVLSGVVNAAVISAGTPTTTVPTYLSDGSYLFGITVTLGPDQFLLPVEIASAANLQSWQFDVKFDNTVVEEIDPVDGTSGIYGSQFTPGDPSSLSFILGGFPFNVIGLVDDVAGSYPSLLNGPSGDGVLAYVLFQYLPGQQTNDPGFVIDNGTIQQAPEPGTFLLLAAALLTLIWTQRSRSNLRSLPMR